MELLELNADTRTATGNGPARALRREGKVPGVLYGPKTEPVLLSVNTKALERALKKAKSGQAFFNLSIQNGDTSAKTVMLKELQTHPISQNFLHVDFYEITTDRKIRVKVPVTTKGKAIGVEMGGMLQIIRRELEVLCFLNHIPRYIELDVTNLDIGDSIHVKEIQYPDVEIPAEVNFTVLTVLGAKKEKAEGEAEEGEEEAAEEGA